jgi:hypothetical protein
VTRGTGSASQVTINTTLLFSKQSINKFHSSSRKLILFRVSEFGISFSISQHNWPPFFNSGAFFIHVLARVNP